MKKKKKRIVSVFVRREKKVFGRAVALLCWQAYSP